MTNNTRHLLAIAAIAATSLLSSGAAFAQQMTPDQSRALEVNSTKQRAEVQAEFQAFRSSGATSPWSRNFVERVANAQPRAAVKAETVRAISAHEVTNHGEFYGIAPSQRAQFATAR